MVPRISEVTHLRGYEMQIRFTDGMVADVDLLTRVEGRGGAFEHCRTSAFLPVLRSIMKRAQSSGRTELICARMCFTPWLSE